MTSRSADYPLGLRGLIQELGFGDRDLGVLCLCLKLLQTLVAGNERALS